MLGGQTVLDTTRAKYVWEISSYPALYIPLDDIRAEFLVDEQHSRRLARGTARSLGLRVGTTARTKAAHAFGEDALLGLAGMVKLDWAALDAWFEEDEEIFVHPRSPYTRVDCIRSTRRVTVSFDGVQLADSQSPVMLFETGLPTRYYLNRTDVDFSHLVHTDTESACPYKGTTSDYWSVQSGDQLHADLAWSYEFPTLPCAPIKGLIAFYNEKLDIAVDGVQLERPSTHFS